MALSYSGGLWSSGGAGSGGGSSAIVATESFTATAAQTDFVLTKTPLANGIIYVSRDGVIAKAADWALVVDIVQFVVGLAVGVEVQVCYMTLAPTGSAPYADGFVSTAGQTEFTLTHDAASVLLVAVNGVVQGTTVFSIVNGDTLTFGSGLVDTDDVWISYLY